MSPRDPVLEPAEVDDLRPTQMTIGFREVEEKRRFHAPRAYRRMKPFILSQA